MPIAGGFTSRRTVPRADGAHLFWLDPALIVKDEGADYTRTHMDAAELTELARSIAAGQGVDQPIIVREPLTGPHRYILVTGQRRWIVARQHSLAEVPVRNLGRISEGEAFAAQIRENRLRSDLHVVDEALAFVRLRDKYGRRQTEIALEYDTSQGQVSELCAIGDATLTLSDAEQASLFVAHVTKEAWRNHCVHLETAAERGQALLALARHQLVTNPRGDPMADAPSRLGAARPRAIPHTTRRERKRFRRTERPNGKVEYRAVVDPAQFSPQRYERSWEEVTTFVSQLAGDALRQVLEHASLAGEGDRLKRALAESVAAAMTLGEGSGALSRPAPHGQPTKTTQRATGKPQR